MFQICTDGKPAALNQINSAIGKKRKADASKGANVREVDDGYKTDQEQWGGRGGDNNVNTLMRPSIPANAAQKQSVKQAGSPPVKQARFSLDQHPRTVATNDDSAQQPLSSLTGSSGTDSASVAPGVISSSGAGALTSSNIPTAAPFNPMVAAVQNVGTSNPAASANKRDNATKSAMDKRREQRNAREKERSCRIARQIDDLRTLLSRGGVIVAKGTKSSVLAEAANYITVLQQQQIQWEQ